MEIGDLVVIIWSSPPNHHTLAKEMCYYVPCHPKGCVMDRHLALYISVGNEPRPGMH